jgi:nucleoid DNA-binding protein
MQKKEIIKKLAADLDLHETESATLFEAMFSELMDLLAKNLSLTVYGFGTFGVKKVPERKRYHPSLKKIVMLPALLKPYFRPSDTLKENLNERK